MDASGVFFTSHSGDRSLLRTPAQRVALALLVIVLLLLPFLVPARWVSLGYAMFITMIAVIGLQICTGYAGQINLGQSAFMGVGAYACALFIYRGNVPVPLALLLGGLAAAGFGALFGLTAARIKGFYLALTTIAAQALFHLARLTQAGISTPSRPPCPAATAASKDASTPAVVGSSTPRPLASASLVRKSLRIESRSKATGPVLSPASALASKVLPVPGGPTSKTPRGADAPSFA